MFLAAILATVIYLTVTRRDVIDNPDTTAAPVAARHAGRERVMVGYYAVLAAATAGLLTWAGAQPHGSSPALEAEGPSAPAVAALPAGQVTAAFPAADLDQFRIIVTDTTAKVSSGDQAGATARITDLETAWDDAEDRLRPLDGAAWTYLDGKIEGALVIYAGNDTFGDAECELIEDLAGDIAHALATLRGLLNGSLLVPEPVAAIQPAAAPAA